jgi:hypothetical protein
VTRWEAFTTVCGHLRCGLLAGPSPFPIGKVRWDLLISVSSQHLVTPALAWCLRDQSAVPPDVQAYFEAALALNGRRNARILDGLARIVAALNSANIEPILLKGVAQLAAGAYPEPALRFLGDIDLLIPSHQLSDAAALLGQIGFETKPNDGIGPDHHHLPMLHERETGIGVELHRHPVPAAFQPILSNDWFFEQTRPLNFQGGRVRLLEPTKAAAHNVAHDQFVHGQYRSRGVELRQLLDLALIRARYGDEIDWAEIDRRFRSAKMGRVLATYLEFGTVLLGLPSVRVADAATPTALADFKRRMGTWRSLRRLAKQYFLARRHEPLGVLRLFRPLTWPNRIRLIKSGFDAAV